MIQIDWMGRARDILNGPGFGAPAPTEVQAAQTLIDEGLEPEMAFLTVKAGAILLHTQNA
jgi:hypothetical protein